MWKKFRTVLFSLIPVIIIVSLIQAIFKCFSDVTYYNFLAGCLIVLFGQVIFVSGLNRSIVPMGEFVGNSIHSKSRLTIYVIFALVFGAFSTIAEPDMQVFASQVVLAGISIPKVIILFVAGAGTGIFIAFGLVRIVLNTSLNWTLVICYVAIFILGYFVEQSDFALALDVGCTTTGNITSPFLLSMGIGAQKVLSNKKNSDENNFGLITLSSVGPIITTLILFLITKKYTTNIISIFSLDSNNLLLSILLDVSLSLIPLILIFFVFEMVFIKISKQEKLKLVIGSIITFVGFYVFLFGIEFGFVNMGYSFGKFLYQQNNLLVTMLLCSILGFFIIYSEPSIKVLTSQVEEVTNKIISAKLVTFSLAIALVISIVLSLIKIYFSISIWIFVLSMYGLSFILMLIVPKLFTAIAYDSGGVGGGVMAISFIFPIMMSMSTNMKDGFGVLGLMAMTPIVVIQLLGLIYKLINYKQVSDANKLLIKLSRTEDSFSNIERLKKLHYAKFEVDL